jgi:sugar phosphate isomerase/epimerase
MTEFTLGINNCFAVKRWPRAQDWAPVVADLGVDLVQHSLDLVDPSFTTAELGSEARTVARASERAGITVHSVFTGLAAYSSNLLLHPDEAYRARALRWYESVVGFATELGASAAGGHVGSFTASDHVDASRHAELWAQLKESLLRLREFANNAGLPSLLLENMASAREPATRAQVQDLLEPQGPGHASLDLCLDIGHQCVPGATGAEADPYSWLVQFGSVAPIVHLQQSDSAGDHHWPFTEEYNEVGRIDAESVLQALDASGARQVALVLEVIPPFEADDMTVVHQLKESVAYWRDALTAHQKL